MKPVKYLLAVPLVLSACVLLALVLLAVAPPRWLAERVARFASDALGVPVTIERLALEPFSLTPAVRVSALGIGTTSRGSAGRPAETDPSLAAPEPDTPSAALLQGMDARVAIDLPAALRGELLIDRLTVRGAVLTLRRTASGRTDLAALLPSLDGADGADEERGGATRVVLPAIRSLSIESTTLSVRDEPTGIAARFELRAGGSTIDTAEPLSLDLDGTLARQGARVPLSVAATLASTTPPQDGLGDLDIALDARSGSLSVRVEGQVADAASAPAADLDLVLSGESLDAVQALTGVELPTVPGLFLTGRLTNADARWRLRRFDAALGGSVFEGDVRLDSSTAPVTLYANIIFTALDLDELVDIVRDGGAGTGERGGWFPDSALGLARLPGVFHGRVRVRAGRVTSRFALESFDTAVALQPDRIRVDPASVSLAGGGIDGALDIDTAGVRPEGSLELALQGLELVRIVEALGIDDDSTGTLGGRARYWFDGDSIADIAASLDGGAFLLMTGGRLDALLPELIGLDVFESIMLLADPGRTFAPIDCAYVDVLARSGMLDIERFVLDTSDTVIVADGTVDLGRQAFDLAIEPHAKDASLFSVHGPVAISGGAGDALSIRPGPDIVARAALAGVLAAVAAPAAALLPLLRPGSGEDSVYCDGLVEKLDDRR